MSPKPGKIRIITNIEMFSYNEKNKVGTQNYSRFLKADFEICRKVPS